MRVVAALGLTLLAGGAHCATAYVSDELVLGVYAEQNAQGQRLATLHSGATVETLGNAGVGAASREFTQIRIPDGTTGWVKSAYLTSRQPAVLKVKELEEELDRTRATTPALADAAQRNELEHLRRELALTRAALQASKGAVSTPARAQRALIPLAGAAAIVALGCGYWLGYAMLARRIKDKFGGIKVY